MIHADAAENTAFEIPQNGAFGESRVYTVGPESGRIDATLMFNTRLFALMLIKAGICRALWDRHMMIYHHTHHHSESERLLWPPGDGFAAEEGTGTRHTSSKRMFHAPSG